MAVVRGTDSKATADPSVTVRLGPSLRIYGPFLVPLASYLGPLSCLGPLSRMPLDTCRPLSVSRAGPFLATWRPFPSHLKPPTHTVEFDPFKSLSSKVNLHHTINFRRLCSTNLVTQWSRLPQKFEATNPSNSTK